MMQDKGSKTYLFSIVLVAVLGGLLFGYDTAVISGAERGLQAFFMGARIQDNPLLEKIPDSEYYTSSAIQKWIEENPSALSNASRLHFLGIEDESTLVQQFAKAKGKQESARYTAVIMDIQGYTVIVVKQKSDGQYVLAWAEPQCKDKYKDRLLNSIYFTGPNTLSMQYYHGKRTFSYSLNLSNKQIKR